MCWWRVIVAMPCFANLRPHVIGAFSWSIDMRCIRCLHNLPVITVFAFPSIAFSANEKRE